MEPVFLFGSLLSGLSLMIWLYLWVLRGFFWRIEPRLLPSAPPPASWPSVAIIVPARNEADLLPVTLPTLLIQDYPGPFHVYLVDDCSADDTGKLARRIARESDAGCRLSVVSGRALPSGWAGKPWALHQGVAAAQDTAPLFLLFTDADIVHPPDSLRRLVGRGVREKLDLVSAMVMLRVHDRWERLLIPAFVFFFAKLYPFRWVNDATRSPAAAAGGCLLVSRAALEGSGGIEGIASDLIDDIALARQVNGAGGRIWLGFSREICSRRRYGGVSGVWKMVSRTAYTQLRRSPILLGVTILGMILTYLIPPAAALGGLSGVLFGFPEGFNPWITAAGLATWALMTGTFYPMIRWYGVPGPLALLLPLAALLYTGMTIDSAIDHFRGTGGGWKDRTYGQWP